MTGKPPYFGGDQLKKLGEAQHGADFNILESSPVTTPVEKPPQPFAKKTQTNKVIFTLSATEAKGGQTNYVIPSQSYDYTITLLAHRGANGFLVVKIGNFVIGGNIDGASYTNPQVGDSWTIHDNTPVIFSRAAGASGTLTVELLISVDLEMDLRNVWQEAGGGNTPDSRVDTFAFSRQHPWTRVGRLMVDARLSYLTPAGNSVDLIGPTFNGSVPVSTRPSPETMPDGATQWFNYITGLGGALGNVLFVPGFGVRVYITGLQLLTIAPATNTRAEYYGLALPPPGGTIWAHACKTGEGNSNNYFAPAIELIPGDTVAVDILQAGVASPWWVAARGYFI